MDKEDTHQADRSQVQVFKVSRSWKIVFSIASPPLIALFGWLMILPFLEGRFHETWFVIFCLLIGGFFVVVFLYYLIYVHVIKIECYPDKIKEIKLVKSREYFIDRMKGFRILPTQYIRTLQIEPKQSNGKKFKTPFFLDNNERGNGVRNGVTS